MHKQKLYVTHFLKGNSEQQIYYKQYANKLNKTKIAAKKLYYETELKKAQNDSFKTWYIVKSLLPSSRKDPALPEKLNIQSNTITDIRDIADAFNDYFYNIGQNLANKIIQHNANAYKTYLTSRNSSLFFHAASPFEVMQQRASLKNKKSCRYDNISAFFIVVGVQVLSNPLSYLFNLAFQFRMFPLCLKTAKVIPIFNSGDKSDISNYRPISIPSTFSKILEKLI